MGIPDEKDVSIESTRLYKYIGYKLKQDGYYIKKQNTFSIEQYNTYHNIFKQICDNAVKKGWKCSITCDNIDNTWKNIEMTITKPI